MDASRPKPIVSARVDDPELEERLDRFVFDLGNRIDTLQDLEAEGGLPALEEATHSFCRESRELGYEPLARAAEQVLAACSERNPEAARKGVVLLTDLSKRVRAGHRGAA